MTQTVTGALAKQDSGIISVMWGRKTHFAAILPGHIEVKGFLGTAAAALYANPELMKAAERSPDSLITALMRCAALGHQPGTDEYYLTPRKKAGVPQVLGIEGYRGIVERMYRSGAVASVVVREVCAYDYFRYVEGEDDKPVHSFGGQGTTGGDFFGAAGSRDRGLMVGVYAYAKLVTGAVSRVVILSRDDVLAARDAGGYKPDDQYTPWNRMDAGAAHPEFQGRSMWWKTAARRLEPWVPTSAEYRREQLRAAQASQPVTAYPGGIHPAAGPPPVLDITDADVVEDVPAAGGGGGAAAEATPASVRRAGNGHGSTGPATGTPAAAGPAAGPDQTASNAVPEHEVLANPGQVGVVRAQWNRLGYDDNDPAQKEERLIFTARLAGRAAPLGSTNDLTPAQARKAYKALEGCKDRPAVLDLISKLNGGES